MDAFPNQMFAGNVSQIRLQPQVVSNVTTYNTIVDVPNRELKLKPGMTADVTIEVARRDGVLRVPNAALRFKPTAEIFAMLGQTPPYTEVTTGDLAPGTELVTSVTGDAADPRTPAATNPVVASPRGGRGR